MIAQTYKFSDEDLLAEFRLRDLAKKLKDDDIESEAGRRGFLPDDDDCGPERLVDDTALADARLALQGGDIPECLLMLGRALTGGDTGVEFYAFHGLADTVERFYRRKFNALSR